MTLKLTFNSSSEKKLYLTMADIYQKSVDLLEESKTTDSLHRMEFDHGKKSKCLKCGALGVSEDDVCEKGTLAERRLLKERSVEIAGLHNVLENIPIKERGKVLKYLQI